MVLVLAILLFNWNMLRGPIERKVSAATGREMHINGNLDVDLSLHPLIRIQGITLSNAAWGSQPQMLSIDELAFRIDLMKLLRGQVILPEIHLQKPELLLEEAADGRANWQFKSDQADKGGGAAPEIRELDIRDGQLSYKNPQIDTDVTVALNTTADGPDQRPGIRLQGHGRYRGEEFRLHGETGGVLALRDTAHPYPIALEASAGQVRAKVQGSIPIPLNFSTVDLHLELQGPDFAKLYPLIPVPLPESPPFRLQGHLVHEQQTWRFEKFNGRVGDSDLSGDFRMTTGERTSYAANVTSQRLAFKDIAGFVHSKDTADAAAADQAPERKPGDKVLSKRPYNFERLHAVDADVRFQGKEVVATKLPLDDVDAHFKLDHGLLTIDPLNFGVADGTIATALTLDARKNPMDAKLDLRARRLHLGKLIPSLEQQVGEGMITGRGNLSGTGNSVADLLGTADGEVAAIMSGGNFSRLLLKLSNIDVAKAVPLWLKGDEKTQIRCVVADFKAEHGVLKSQTLVMDTKDTKLVGAGSIDLKQEKLDLQLRAEAKSPSPLALHGPIHIGGTFAKVDVGVDKASVGARVGAAAALAALLGPLAAFLPVVEWGLTDDADCGALLREVDLGKTRQHNG